MEEIHLEVAGMSCSGCVASVRSALEELPGVQVRDVRVGHATLLLDRMQTDMSALIDAVQDAGYEAREAA